MSDRFRLTSPHLKLSENDVEKACVHLLRAHHYYPLRLQSGRFIHADRAVIAALRQAQVPCRWMTDGEPGIPDYVVPKFFVETKAPGGILSEVQEKKIWTLKEHWDLDTAVVESVEQLIEWLGKRAGGMTGP